MPSGGQTWKKVHSLGGRSKKKIFEVVLVAQGCEFISNTLTLLYVQALGYVACDYTSGFGDL